MSDDAPPEGTPLERHVAIVHVPRRRASDREPRRATRHQQEAFDDAALYDELVSGRPGQKSRAFKERCAIAERGLAPKLYKAMHEAVNPLDPDWQRAFWKVTEHAHGKPVVQAEVGVKMLIEVDILDE